MKILCRKILLATALLGALSSLVACGTVGGVGKDVEKLGEEIQDASN